MPGKILKLIELSVIIMQLISSIITAGYCSYALKNINDIFFDRDYKFYISDFKKKFKLFLNLNFTENPIEGYDDYIYGSYLNVTCFEKRSTAELSKFNKWNNGYININYGLNYDSENIDFKIVEAIEECVNGKKICYENTYYKTCINQDYPCPITYISNKSNISDAIYNNFFIRENFTDIKTKYATNLMYSKLVDGVPIINMKISLTKPCYLDYMIKSNTYLTRIVDKNNSFVLKLVECYKFDNRLLNIDSEGDFDVNSVYNEINDENSLININHNNSNEYDERYIQAESTSLKSYLDLEGLNLENLGKIENSSESVETNDKYNVTLYYRKLIQAKENCTAKIFKISSQIDVFNIAQVRILLLRYLNWNFIDIIFIVMLNIYLRGYYIFKRLRYKNEAINSDEINFQKETNKVVKILHYYIILIKLISILVSKYYYTDIDIIPKDVSFYDYCITDNRTLYTYVKINFLILNLINSISIISNINIYTLVYDLMVTLNLAYFIKRNKKI